MAALWMTVRGTRFVDLLGRQVILRGLNLGGDCKLPYPDGGTHLPSDFSDHEHVSFVGRPFPLVEADEHLARIAGWGFNVLRLVVTWEAVEHAGPRQYDDAYIEYIGLVCAAAQRHGLAVFVDFHQDVWSRMSGGSGAPGWIFDHLGLDHTRFDAANAAHVMQHRYDYNDPRPRQEERYPTMSWPVNGRMAVNGILWTAFFAGNAYTPQWRIDGVNVQEFLQSHYFGAVRALAARLAGLPNVLGFDSLNEPGTGWIGKKLTQRPGIGAPAMQRGPAWTPLDGLAVARGLTREVPYLVPDEAGQRIAAARPVVMNPQGVSIWRAGVADPFEQAGAWRLRDGQAVALDEDFFRIRDGRAVDAEGDFLGPFFRRMAETMRSVRPDWLLFAEINPHGVAEGRCFPKEMPPGCVNANHWYDIRLLMSKRFDFAPGDPALQELDKLYHLQLNWLRMLGERIGAPTLIGEFGTPYDLNGGESFRRWAAGEHGEAVWAQQAAALSLAYDTLDDLLLSSAQWNYTARNRNDLRIGDGWNQEDLSVYSRDQQGPGNEDGARGRDGFCRPYVQRTQGTLTRMRYHAQERRFTTAWDADAGIAGATEIFVPRALAPGIEVKLDGAARWQLDAGQQRLSVTAEGSGPVSLEIRFPT